MNPSSRSELLTELLVNTTNQFGLCSRQVWDNTKSNRKRRKTIPFHTWCELITITKLLVFKGRHDDGHEIVAQNMFRQRSQHIVSVGYTSSQSIEKEENTRRPHIHISHPEMRCLYTLDGDVSQLVVGIHLGITGVESDKMQTLWQVSFIQKVSEILPVIGRQINGCYNRSRNN